MTPILLLLVGAIAFIIVLILVAMSFRQVVPTNEVHIVQSSSKTTSYGKDTKNGNVYYRWPEWLPLLGITSVRLPVSVFQIDLKAYDAYDTGRVPFEVDVVAFFRVEDSNLCAQRVTNFAELQTQLTMIVRGSVRTVLAAHDIDRIMLERSTFGDAFTKEVETQLKNWGVTPVKNIELMDIRDGGQNMVIHNIMQKKKSLIEMQSRSEVAENMKNAQVAEINANRDALSQKQMAEQAVGIQTVEKEKQVQLATQAANQSIKEQERVTKEKEMAVLRVAQVQQAEIDKNVNLVKADQAKQVNILTAEGEKQQFILHAEGNLESQKREAEGTVLVGNAKAEAEKAMQLAPVQAQITLAKEIGQNEGYQKYLITIRTVEANQAVGIEQAKALEKSDIKIIANTGDPVAGIGSVRDLFSSKGGQSVGAMLEGLANSEQGAKVIGAIGAMAKGKA